MTEENSEKKEKKIIQLDSEDQKLLIMEALKGNPNAQINIVEEKIEPLTAKETKKLLLKHSGVRKAIAKMQVSLQETSEAKNLLRTKRMKAKKHAQSLSKALKKGHLDETGKQAIQDELRFVKLDLGHKRRLLNVIRVKGNEASKKEYESIPGRIPFEQFVEHLHKQIEEEKEIIQLIKRMLAD
ncbi:MAG: hypothetical protein Q7S92_01885 [Candidatus Diapherotrites archaeon]|nr:hypothetical protein [Candidatus Diapherotrites archaeon]